MRVIVRPTTTQMVIEESRDSSKSHGRKISNESNSQALSRVERATKVNERLRFRKKEFAKYHCLSTEVAVMWNVRRS